MKSSLLGTFLCGGVIALLIAALLMASGEDVPRAGALVALLLVASVLPLASAAWSSGFRHR